MVQFSSQHLFRSLFTTRKMQMVFSDRHQLQKMLDFEAALARTEARIGMIPPAAVHAITKQCQAELYSIEALAQEATQAGNPVIPLIRMLTKNVAQIDADAARYVHWGATSQDVMDTALILQLREVFQLIEEDLVHLVDLYARHAITYKSLPMAGRTWMQQSTPITFGYKVASWLSAIDRHRERLQSLRVRALVLQFGGASGTLAALGKHGVEVAEALAEELQLEVPDIPWHTQRDRIVEVATVLGMLVGTLGKIARDLSLMSQTEVSEAFEPTTQGRGGSSTMPQKRNPVGAAVVLGVAQRVPALVATMLGAMTQEHERGLGGWQAEWETLPEICLLTAGALHQTVLVAEGLEIDEMQMQANLEVSKGLIFAESVSMALAQSLGRLPAHTLVEKASRKAVTEGRHLLDVLKEDAIVLSHLDNSSIEALFDAARATGLAELFVDRVVNHRETISGK